MSYIVYVCSISLLVNFINVMLPKYDWNEYTLDLRFTLYTNTRFSFNFLYASEHFIKYLSLFDSVSI
jgi:hypothetical protein